MKLRQRNSQEIVEISNKYSKKEENTYGGSMNIVIGSQIDTSHRAVSGMQTPLHEGLHANLDALDVEDYAPVFGPRILNRIPL
jgi:hypothetical protein